MNFKAPEMAKALRETGQSAVLGWGKPVVKMLGMLGIYYEILVIIHFKEKLGIYVCVCVLFELGNGAFTVKNWRVNSEN